MTHLEMIITMVMRMIKRAVSKFIIKRSEYQGPSHMAVVHQTPVTFKSHQLQVAVAKVIAAHLLFSANLIEGVA